MIHTIGAFASLYAFWLLLSGFFTPFLLAAGVGSALAVVWFTRRMHVLDPEGQPLQFLLPSVRYWFWLQWQIVLSGWTVCRLIVDSKMPISPTLVRFRPGQTTAVGLVSHANSITLTPGTISVLVGADEFLVHAITREGAAGCIDSEMNARVTRTFEGSR